MDTKRSCYVSVEKASLILGISKKSVLTIYKRKKIQFIKDGRKIFFLEKDILSCAESSKKWKDAVTDLSEENIDKIVESFSKHGSLDGVYRDIGINQKRVRQALEKRGISPNPRQKFFINKQFFNKIDTPEKAYFMGFLVTDGYLLLNKFGYGAVAIKLQKRDSHILREFSSLILDSGDADDFVSSYQNYSVLHIQGNHFFDQLCNLGLSMRKTWTIKVNDKMHADGLFENAFVLGLIDGDGSIVKRTVKKPNKSGGLVCENYYFSFVGNKFVCDYLCSFLDKKGISFRRTEKLLESGNILYRVEVSRVCDVTKLGYILYSSCPIFLTRKYKRFLCHLSRKLPPKISDTECRKYLSSLQETHKLS